MNLLIGGRLLELRGLETVFVNAFPIEQFIARW
jgi:hypothetical protein